MAALTTSHESAGARGGSGVERVRLLRPLGTTAFPALSTWAALEEQGAERGRLVAVERVRRRAFKDADIADCIRDARRLIALDHPNVARVCDVIVGDDEVLIVSEFVDGSRWNELAAVPLEAALRVLVDVLGGLSALHNLRDAKRQPLKLIHGCLTPQCIVVSPDGMGRLVGLARPRSTAVRRSAYLAPEVLLEDDSADGRADTYSVGVMLWEALSGRRFLPDLQPTEIVTRLLSARVPPLTLPETSPWAAPLADAVRRALSPDPAKRFPSASAMAAELRRIAGIKLHTSGRVATLVRAAFGDAIRARRQDLELGVVRALDPSAGLASAEELSIDVDDEPVEEISDTAPTVPPPPIPALPPQAARDLAPAGAPPPSNEDPAADAYVPAHVAPVADRADDTTTAPLTLSAMQVTAAPFEAPFLPRRRAPAAGYVVACAAVVAMAVFTWWLAAHGHDPRAEHRNAFESPAPPVASSALLPHVDAPSQAAAPPESTAIAVPSGVVPDVGATKDESEISPSAAPTRSVMPAVMPPPFPGRPLPAAARRGYDPQGI